LSGALKRGIDMSANIFATHTIEETGLVHDEEGLSVRTAENEMFAPLAEFVVKIFKGIEASGIDSQHFSHAQNEDLRLLAGTLEGGFKFVDSAKEESAENAKDEDAVRNFFADKRMVSALGFGGLIHRGNLRRFRDAFDEEDGGEDHADFDGDCEVSDYGETKSSQEHSRVALRPLAKPDKLVPFTHVVSDNDEDCA